MQQDHLRGSKNQKQLHDVVNRMRAGLRSAYERNWKGIQRRDDDERERAIAILRWAVFALRPLTVSKLTDALLVLYSRGKVLCILQQKEDSEKYQLFCWDTEVT